MPLVAFQHIGLEQRVVRNAAQRDAAVGEDMRVVLDVLAELGVFIALQPRPQFFQHPLARQLIRYAGIDMTDGNIGRTARFDGQ